MNLCPLRFSAPIQKIVPNSTYNQFRNAFVSLCIFFIASAASPSFAATKASITLGYGESGAQQMDIYLPPQPVKAPVIVLVHGGGWRLGDKDSRAVTKHKTEHWLPMGFIVVSLNYRLLPDANPLEQAQDVAAAISFLQTRIFKWGGDPKNLFVIGHSAGAHLTALIGAAPENFSAQGIKPWRGSILLDSAALDVPSIMNNKHPRLYDQAFGDTPDFWLRSSPLHVLKPTAVPMLIVCSSKRNESCAQADSFISAAEKIGVKTQKHSEHKSHRHINTKLGSDEVYTKVVDNFMLSLMTR
jgi:arylformamidase